MKYEVGATVNLPDGKEAHDLAFLNLSLDQIKSILEEDYPTMTSFMLVCVPIKEVKNGN